MSSDTSGEDGGEDDDLRAIYGEDFGALPEPTLAVIPKKIEFLPWHHPVKQIVRDRQWAALTRRQIEKRAGEQTVLRYFTLPGPDLLDVKVLSEVCRPLGVRIEYFGFNASRANNDELSFNDGAWVTAESALRQSDRITDDAIILPDRLEDIALARSQANLQLAQRGTFDVINIDACDHLAFQPPGRERSTFDALRALLQHQMRAQTPWLLFITTRVDPEMLAEPGNAMQHAVLENLKLGTPEFGEALAEALEADIDKLEAALAQIWGERGSKFLKLYSIGLGKFLLQFFHAQINVPAEVELASAYAYRVHLEEPDMLALAFRVTPEQMQAMPPNIGGAAAIPMLEPRRAARIANRARALQDLDGAMAAEPDLAEQAILNTATLLRDANYDIRAWKTWLSGHPRRAVNVNDLLVED